MPLPPADDTRPDSGDLDDLDDLDADTETSQSATAVAAPAAKRRTQQGIEIPASSLHGHPTQALPRSRSSGTPTTGDTQQTTADTPLEALRLDEVARTRIFVKVAMVIAVLAGGAMFVVGGDPLAKKLVFVGITAVLASSIWLLARIRDPMRYRIHEVTAVGYIMLVGAFLGVYFWGIYSPGPALILMGIYFFSLGASQRAIWFIYGSCATVQATLAILTTTGVMEDRGLLGADALTTTEAVVVQLLVQLLYLCAFVIARSSRKATLDAVTQLEKAIRDVSQREAMLAEVRDDLDRAMRVGGPGRFTDRNVGNFRLGNLIGRGGMGEVYEGTNKDSGDRAAVKLLHPHLLDEGSHAERFRREIDAVASLESDHVVRVIAFGDEGDAPYLAMELLRGHDLAYFLRRKRKLSLSRVVALVRQVGAGIDAARRAGIVHRDLKPQNLFLHEHDGTPGTWKILDFGVSKLGGSGGTLTQGNVVGTPGYMAPEQARGSKVDHRADVYALAAIAYRCLTGHPPFHGKDVPTTLYDVVYKMPRRPSELADIDPDLDLALAVGMAKKPENRFDSGEELADAIATAGKGNLAPVYRTMGEELLRAHTWGETL